jgi:Zn-dependent M28 family amino/carboxypeptidase
MFRPILTAIIIIVVVGLTTFGWQGFYRTQETPLRDKELPERLKTHVVKLSDEIGERSIFRYPALTEAADYITKVFQDFGFSVEFQEYLLMERRVKNIIVSKPGNKKSDELIVIGAHYDTCFNPGADDNASGVAGLLELARLIASEENNKTIRFIAFTCEEPPFFKTKDMGSFVYARGAREKQENIKAAVILEMLGYYSNRPFSQRYPLFLGPFYPNRANFIAVVGNFSNQRLVRWLTHHFREYSQFPISSVVLFDFIPGVDFSDHWSFWQNDFSAVMVTDTAFYRYRHYHRDSDTFEKLDYQSMAAVVEGLKEAILKLAE